jgi:hypothetical protein
MEYIYEVEGPRGRKESIPAKNSGEAKRIYCRRHGISPSDYWCGVTSLKAKRIAKAEDTRRQVIVKPC